MAIVDVIKHEISDTELVGKFKSDNIKLGSQLIVYPSQTAFFVKGGKVLDEFTSGTYTLNSENIPILNKVVNIPFGGETPFTAEVWFVNQVSLLDCKWGTATPLQVEDPKYEVIVPIRAFGQYGFKITNSRVFLEKLVGNMPTFAVDKVVSYFRGIILSKLTTIIYNKLREEFLSTLNVNSQVEGLSEYAQSHLQDTFLHYGISLELFNIISISVKEDDPSFVRLKQAKDEVAHINIMGKENYRLSRSYDVLEAAAENEGGMGTAMGLGAGVGMGGVVGKMASDVLSRNEEETPPPIPNTTRYFIAINGKRFGPCDYNVVKNKIANGEIDGENLVWKKGMRDWDKICNMEDFQSLLDEECPPPLPTI